MTFIFTVIHEWSKLVPSIHFRCSKIRSYPTNGVGAAVAGGGVGWLLELSEKLGRGTLGCAVGEMEDCHV